MNDALLPLLAYLATTAGAGAAASDLFNRARAWWCDQPVGTDPVDRGMTWLLCNRAGARISVLAMAMAISIIASGILAHAQGQPLGDALDRAAVAALASQIVHLRELLGQRSQVAP
ncbi:MAG TPA: hypothetical protein PKK15_04705 [Kouleothrix sp.]|nr:hypothetical protein [Kouleothrix sp.]